MIAQAYPSVEHFARQDDGSWIYSPTTALTANSSLTSVGCDLPLAEIYDRIEFPLTEDTFLL